MLAVWAATHFLPLVAGMHWVFALCAEHISVWHISGGNSLPPPNDSPGFPKPKTPSYLSSDPVQVQAREEAYCPNSALNLSALKKRLHTVGKI